MATPSPARQLHGSSGLSIVIAILLILAGLAAIFLPFVAGIAASIAVAWLCSLLESSISSSAGIRALPEQ